eukprot:2578983-Pleurochrysis_carterae.AAC.1
MRRSEIDRSAVARAAKGSLGTTARRGAMAACARVNCAEEKARMAEECPGATHPAVRPFKSAAEETEEAALLASAFKHTLSARRRMTAAGESRVCTRAAT